MEKHTNISGIVSELNLKQARLVIILVAYIILH